MADGWIGWFSWLMCALPRQNNKTRATFFHFFFWSQKPPMEKSMGESVHRRHVPEPGADVVVDESDLGERHGSIPSVGNGAGHAGPSSSSTRLDGPNAIQGSNLIEKSPLGILSVMKGTQIYVIVLFVAWNLFSSLAQNTTKSILSEVSLSLTVTLLQFVAIISFCVVLMKASLVPTQPLTWGVAKKSSSCPSPRNAPIIILIFIFTNSKCLLVANLIFSFFIIIFFYG
jgi:hypothetical protein